MANVSGAGTEWNLPNYAGQLLTPDHEVTPLLNIIGDLNGGAGMITENFEFPLNSYYEHETAAQPSITETASLTAPTALEFVRAQEKNVVQKHHQAVTVSYDKLAGRGRMSGINTAGAMNAAPNELDFQVATHLKKVRRDVEYTIAQGSYQIATSAGVASKTRGLNAAAVAAGNTVAAAGADFDKTLLDTLLITMDDNGADFENMVIYATLFQRQRITEVYGLTERSRTMGGMAIDTIKTEVGDIGVLQAKSGFQAAGTIGLYDMAKVRPVFMLVPDPDGGFKGIFFLEPLAKDGASEKHQLFGYFGLDYGASWFHGSITGLSTS